MNESTQTPKEPEEIVYEGRAFTPTEQFYHDLGFKIVEQNHPRQIDFAKQLVTLNVTLLGGAIVFLKDDILPAWARVLAMVFFLASLGTALHGNSVRREKYALGNPPSIEEAHNKISAFRYRYVSLSMLFLWLGFAAAVLGAMIRFVQTL